MSKPSPKQNFMQTLLIMAMVFLGLQLFMGGLKPPAETRTLKEIQTKMRQLNRDVMDVSIATEQQSLNRRIDADQKEGKLTPNEADWLRLEGTVLVADTKLKAAMFRNDINRSNLAFMAIQPLERKYIGKPDWTRTIEVGPVRVRPQKTVTASNLYQAVVADLNARNKKDRILGFLPGYQLIDGLVAVTGRVPSFSYAFAALLLAIVVRAIIWPLAQRQLMWSRQMSQLQPMIKELQEAYAKKDPTGAYKSSPEFQQKMMGLYKEYGINPASGCLPALAQMPLFLLVYQCMLHYRFEFKNGVFLWINPGTSAATNGFVAPSLGEMDYILLVIYGLSMVVTTYLAPISDPSNAKQQRLMGITVSLVFTVMMFFWPLPSAFVLYWIFTNVLSTIQSLRAYRLPLPPLVKVNAPNGAVLPTNGSMNGAFKNTGAPQVHRPKPKRKK